MKPAFKVHVPPGLPPRRERDPRPSSAKRGYGRAWRKLRQEHLDVEPYCVRCRQLGQLVEATDVDHIVSRRRGGSDEHSNLQSLCHSCHSRKTAKHDGGGGR